VNNSKKNINKLKLLVEELTIRDTNVFKRKELLELLMSITSDGLWDWNFNTNEVFLNPNYKKQLGYKPEELKDSPETWEKLMFDEDLKLMKVKLKKHVDSKGKEPFKMVARYTHKDGQTVKILCRGMVVEWDENNNPIRMVGTHVDLTDIC
jgi:PAS domain S-box-containing protein